MPRNTRELLVRYHDQTQNDLDRALERLRMIAEEYGDVRPEHTIFIENIALMLIQTKDYLREFRERWM